MTPPPSTTRASAPPGSCPIVEDVEIRCDDSEFADPGLRVAAAPDTTYMVTSSSDYWWLFSVADGSAEFIPDLPGDFARGTILLAVDPQGRPQLVADETSPPSYERGLVMVGQTDEGWVHELIYDSPDRFSPASNFEVDHDGAHHVWYSSDPPSGMSLGVREGPDTWSSAVAELPGDGDWPRFAIGADGQIAAFALTGSGPWRVTWLTDGEEQVLGSSSFDNFPGFYMPTLQPTPTSDVTSPPFAVAYRHDSGLHVSWPTADDWNEVELEGTALPNATCFAVDPVNGECNEICSLMDSGLEDFAHAIARTEDGRIWIAYVITHFDELYEFEFNQSMTFGNTCRPVLITDNTTATLHLAEVTLDGDPPTEAFAVPVRRPPLDTLFHGVDDAPRMIDMRAFGSTLAIGVSNGPTDDRGVRVLRVDTSGL